MKTSLFQLALAGTLAVSTPVLTPAIAQETAPLTSPSTAPDDAPFEWRLRLKAGQKFRVTTETTMENSQQFPKMPGAKTPMPAMQMSDKSRIVVEQTVVSSDEKGARIEMIYREAKDSSRMMQGGKVVYDSAQPPAGMEAMGDASQKMVGAKLSFLLSPRGQVSEIVGIEAYLAKMRGDGDAAKESPQLQAARQSVAGFFTPEMVKTFLTQAYDAMPPGPVAKGASWTHTSTLPVMGTTFTTDTQNTFVSRRNGVISIRQSGQFASDGGAQVKIPLPASATQGAAPIAQMDLQGTSTGEITIDEQTGLTLRNFESQSVAGEMVMSGMTGKGSVITIPMQMKSETTVTTEEIKTAP